MTPRACVSYGVVSVSGLCLIAGACRFAVDQGNLLKSIGFEGVPHQFS
jgi:hypothetical protein